jgi:hypothetical protein
MVVRESPPPDHVIIILRRSSFRGIPNNFEMVRAYFVKEEEGGRRKEKGGRRKEEGEGRKQEEAGGRRRKYFAHGRSMNS